MRIIYLENNNSWEGEVGKCDDVGLHRAGHGATVQSIWKRDVRSKLSCPNLADIGRLVLPDGSKLGVRCADITT
jgi:hypothetical protein